MGLPQEEKFSQTIARGTIFISPRSLRELLLPPSGVQKLSRSGFGNLLSMTLCHGKVDCSFRTLGAPKGGSAPWARLGLWACECQ